MSWICGEIKKAQVSFALTVSKKSVQMRRLGVCAKTWKHLQLAKTPLLDQKPRKLAVSGSLVAGMLPHLRDNTKLTLVLIDPRWASLIG